MNKYLADCATTYIKPTIITNSITLIERSHDLQLFFIGISAFTHTHTHTDVGLALSDDRTHTHKRHEQTYRHILFKGGGSTIPRTVPAWNKLPRALVQASSTDTFKSGLEALCP